MTDLPQNIESVLQTLDQIIEESISNDNYLAIFAYIYRRTTAAIKLAIEKEEFENNARMEKFDVVFANRYIVAYQRWMKKEQTTMSWQSTFDVATNRLTTIQHLAIGMNAHINFDLGLAAATIAPGAELKDLETDFMKVNDILARLINEMQIKISNASKLMFLLDWVGGKSDEKIIAFSIKTSRHFAWNVAKTVAFLDGIMKNKEVDFIDQQVAAINHQIINPHTKTLKFVLRLIGYFEKNKVKEIVNQLQS